MFLSVKDITNHIKTIYELSYSHYAWIKKTNLQGTFPDYCCGSSSRNLFLNLMHKGYSNSTLLSDYKYNHTYVALPFVFGKNKRKGFIIIDPTSDQLFYDKKMLLEIIFLSLIGLNGITKPIDMVNITYIQVMETI